MFSLRTGGEASILTKKDLAIADRDNDITESEGAEAKTVLTKIIDLKRKTMNQPQHRLMSQSSQGSLEVGLFQLLE